MRHRHKLTKLGRNTNQRQALFRQLVNSLIIHEKITTTIAKAKVLAGLMDKLMTQAKKDTLAARRQLLAFLSYKPAVHKLVDILAPRTKTRTSGFTKLVRVGTRRGDNAMLAQIEFIDKEIKKEVKKPEVKK
ncbi:MAG: 50S ribosomal protein L17 [Candidatus Beckwithbacteria bacterium]|nr:50S ribosomal protein L17 [Candidatus Beckwithbacteria bacterium]